MTDYRPLPLQTMNKEEKQAVELRIMFFLITTLEVAALYARNLLWIANEGEEHDARKHLYHMIEDLLSSIRFYRKSLMEEAKPTPTAFVQTEDGHP